MARKKLPEILNQKEVEKLLNQPSKKSLIGMRNRAIMKTILNCGLRVSEISKLKVSEIDLVTGDLRIVNGKGGKDRNLLMGWETQKDLLEWKKKRPQSIYFFSTLAGTKLNRRYLEATIKRYAKMAGISKRVYPHLLRHIFATEYYRQKLDIVTLSRILGHESITTTQIYITLANIEVEESMKTFKEF